MRPIRLQNGLAKVDRLEVRILHGQHITFHVAEGRFRFEFDAPVESFDNPVFEIISARMGCRDRLAFSHVKRA